MNKITYYLGFAIFLIFSAKLYAVEPSTEAAEIVKQSMSSLMQKNAIPGAAVELYIEGKPYAYYFGYANQSKKLPVTSKTIFELGSVSKVMTSLLLAQEIDVAKMSLDDPLTKYLPDLSEDYSDISLKSLATHTSGLPFNTPQGVTSVSSLHHYLSEWSPDDAPGERWTYSNFGIGMLGYAIEGSSHKNFNQLYRLHLLNPLDMQAIGITVPAKLKKYYAQGYDAEGNPVQPLSSGVFPAAYAIKASAGDMQHFLKAAIGLTGTPDRIFYPMRMTQTAYVKLADKRQGLGWQINSLAPENISVLLHVPAEENRGPITVDEVYDKPIFNGDTLIDKTGSTNGFRAYIAVIPNKKSGIVVLTNKSIANNDVVNAARNILLKTTHLVPDHPAAG